MTELFKAESTPFGNISQSIERRLRLSQQQGLIVENQSPGLMELARVGRIHGANTGAGTAKAPNTALPTTTAVWALYNGHDSRKLVVLKVYCYSVSGTLGLGMALIAGLSGTPQAAAVSAYASSVNKPVMPNSQPSLAVFGQNVTLAGAPVWNVLAARDQVSAVSVGSGLMADVEGMFVIPPKYALGGSVLAAAGTTDLFGFGFVWAELDMELG